MNQTQQTLLQVLDLDGEECRLALLRVLALRAPDTLVSETALAGWHICHQQVFDTLRDTD